MASILKLHHIYFKASWFYFPVLFFPYLNSYILFIIICYIIVMHKLSIWSKFKSERNSTKVSVGRYSASWITWLGNSAAVFALYVQEPWWNGRCSWDLLEVVQIVHVVKLIQRAGWVPSVQGQGQDQGLNTLKL